MLTRLTLSSNVDDQTEPCDPANEGRVTELTEAEVVLASGDSACISVDSINELGIDSALDPSAEPVKTLISTLSFFTNLNLPQTLR